MLATDPTHAEAALRRLYCSGCGRRLLDYAALGTETTIRVRCRDCKATTQLRGADVPTLLTALTRGGLSHGDLS